MSSPQKSVFRRRCPDQPENTAPPEAPSGLPRTDVAQRTAAGGPRHAGSPRPGRSGSAGQPDHGLDVTAGPSAATSKPPFRVAPRGDGVAARTACTSCPDVRTSKRVQHVACSWAGRRGTRVSRMSPSRQWPGRGRAEGGQLLPSHQLYRGKQVTSRAGGSFDRRGQLFMPRPPPEALQEATSPGGRGCGRKRRRRRGGSAGR